MERAAQLHAQCPQMEMLYQETYLDNAGWAQFVYGPAGENACRELTGTAGGTGFPIDYEAGTITVRSGGREEALSFDPKSKNLEGGGSGGLRGVVRAGRKFAMELSLHSRRDRRTRRELVD